MSNLDEEKAITSNQELILKCLELILEKSELSDQKLMLKSIELILSKTTTRHLNDVIEESERLFNFINWTLDKTIPRSP